MTGLHLNLAAGDFGSARKLTSALREAIRTGRLHSGARLPASRALATDLAVSRGVVVEAYEQLTAEGLLVAKQGSGTRVAATAPPARQPQYAASATVPARFDLRVGTPDLSAFPRRLWLAAARHVVETIPHTDLGYPDPAGVPRLREALSEYLGRVRAAQADAGQVSIVGGVAHGLSLLVRALGPIRLAVENPTSPRQLPLLEGAGAELIPVPVDGQGMDIAALARTSADAVLLTPAHQYPTGVVLSPERRAALRNWLSGNDAVVIEDDYDAEFRYDREPVGCLQGLIPDRVMLLGSVSKSLAPALRLGWVVSPGWIAERIRRLRAETDLGSPALDQHILARLIDTGDYDRHLRAMRRSYRSRRDVLVAALRQWLPTARIHGISAGQHIQVTIPGVDESALVRRAAELGVAVEGAGAFRLSDGGEPGLVLRFAGLTNARLPEAVRRLARAAEA